MVGNVPMRDRDGRWRKVGERGRYGRCRRPGGLREREENGEKGRRGKVRKRRRGERRKKDDEGCRWEVEELKSWRRERCEFKRSQLTMYTPHLKINLSTLLLYSSGTNTTFCTFIALNNLYASTACDRGIILSVMNLSEMMLALCLPVFPHVSVVFSSHHLDVLLNDLQR
jgi:hypothetical protein